jgi:pimeloyl-ACP methyl ester carboxylesterase
VDGAHNIRKITTDGVTLMKEIAQGRGGDWSGILEFANEFDTTIIDRDKTLDVNRKAWEAIGIAQDDGLINEFEADFDLLWKALFTDHSTTTNLANTFMVATSDLWQEALDNPLSDDLKNITIPSLLLWGRYDFVVSPTLGEEALINLGTPDEDKSLVIFQRSGHSPMQEEPGLFIQVVTEFIEKYK